MERLIVLPALVMCLWTASGFPLRADILDHWTTNQITTNAFGLKHVVYGNGRYVAAAEELGAKGAIYSSEDGLTWTLRFSDNTSWGLSLNYSAGQFAGIGGSGMVDISSDGITWSSASLPSNLFDRGAIGANGQAITYGNGVYVTVGDTNGVGNILTSSDGFIWTSHSINPAPGGRITGVVWGGSGFVAIGNNDGLEYTSATGSGLWSRSSLPGGSSISYGNGLYIVPLNAKTNLLSRNGTTWSLQSTGLTNQLGAVTYAHGLFLAQCGVSSSGGYLVTSTDGTNWIQYAKPMPHSWQVAYWTDFDVSLATDGTRLVSVGAICNPSAVDVYNSFIYTSDILAAVRLTNNPSQQIALSGLVGRNYQIRSIDTLGTGKWRTNLTLPLPNTPYVWTDSTATNSQRFYRAALLP